MSVCKVDRESPTFSDRYVGPERFRDFIHDHIKPRSNVSCERRFDRHDVIWIVEDTSQRIFCLDSLRSRGSEGKGMLSQMDGNPLHLLLLGRTEHRRGLS